MTRGRERSFQSAEAFRSWNSDRVGWGVRKDFRENLVSVFVGNINPVVDSASLWGIFKPFGKVRDVFLSSNTNLRQSCYAFIRFESIEETNKAAQREDGMQIYRWPIRAKVTAYG
ncbi:hypothetical protein Ddye_031768 [Dipteronia dyeriana]|uniref:RRM domain-containing protein n=1 Tax=Dipteronia dyeriana TaxID=168575 RepID=A0AAD9WMX1_9ROSI|nr:hypothetical protein Ddye_031768 [Dipteronia dyeriana]